MATANSVAEKFNKMNISNRDRVNDAIFQTKRTKLHETRREINEKITKEMRMRAGAKNLIDLTKDKKIKSKINIEIDYFESNLRLWKEELEKANSALDTYQNMKHGLPMIPVALKNTLEIDFTIPFRNIVTNHYGDDPDKYNDAFELINNKRRKVQCPQRNQAGIDDHISYYNLLVFIERRFFFQDQSNGIIFSWNDIFTGVPFQQRTAVFEKSGIVFNLGALYSQLAAKMDKTTTRGLDEAQIYLLNSEACFCYLNSSFMNPPSLDLKPEILQMLSGLMKAQSIECKFLLLRKVKMNEERYSNLRCLELVSESFAISTLFDNVYSSLHIELLQYLENIPQAWINLVQVKGNYYKSLAYYLLAERYIQLASNKDVEEGNTISDLSKEVRMIIKPTKYLTLPSKANEAIGLAKLLINEALQSIEEAIKLAAMNSYLRNLEDMTSFLKCQHKEWLDKLHSMYDRESYDLLSCPELNSRPRNNLNSDINFQKIIYQKPEYDPFQSLGPIETFNSRVKIGPVRTVHIIRDQKLGFGFTVKGKGPVKVINVEKNSNAEKSGLKVGDVVLSLEEFDLRWSSQETLVEMTSQRTIIKLAVTSISEPSLSRHHTFSSSVSADQVGNSSHFSDSLSLSLPSKKSGKMTWKQRLSGTLKRKKAKPLQTQSSSTLF